MTTDMQSTFGHRLREHRKSLGLSQEKMADRLECHRTYLGAVERGERNLTMATMQGFADKLGVDVLDLLKS